MNRIRIVLFTALIAILTGDALQAGWCPLQEGAKQEDAKQELKKQEKDVEEAKEEEEEKELTPMEKFRKLSSGFVKQRGEFLTKLRKAKTREERMEFAKNNAYPNANLLVDDMMEIAASEDKAASFQALTWVMSNIRTPAIKRDAMESLLENHLENKRIGSTTRTMTRSRRSAEIDEYLTTIRDKSPHEKVRANAAVAYANYRKSNVSTDKEELEEVAKLFEDAVEEFKDVKLPGGSIEEIVEAPLFELKNLQIGMQAPNIQGEDVDGVEFELKDYLGKVVVIDFWGDW